MAQHDYRLMIHMSPNFHDNSRAPYFWCILRHESTLTNNGSGWAATPEQAFSDGMNYLNKYILTDIQQEEREEAEENVEI